MLKRVLLNLIIMSISIAIALAVGEVAIRLIKPVYDYRDRSLLFSSPVFKLYSGGSVRYLPHEKIREVAVYNEKIEYDVLYRTNNLGFIDLKDYGPESVPGRSYYAFIGDSFTAGVNGGNPWVPQLRNNNVRAEVYNFGVAGTGFEHFYRLLHDMKNKVTITHIIIVAITDDFFREYWHPLITEGSINFCSVPGLHTSCQPAPIASSIPLAASEEEVRKVAKLKYTEMRAKIDEFNSAKGLRAKLESALYDDSALFYYAKLLLDSYNRTHKPSHIEGAMESMRKIKAEFPAVEIHLVHLPQKYEVMTSNYYLNIASQVSELGISYFPALEKCSWSSDMFFTRDAHPNAYGYKNISRCVSGYLFK